MMTCSMTAGLGEPFWRASACVCSATRSLLLNRLEPVVELLEQPAVAFLEEEPRLPLLVESRPELVALAVQPLDRVEDGVGDRGRVVRGVQVGRRDQAQWLGRVGVEQVVHVGRANRRLHNATRSGYSRV